MAQSAARRSTLVLPREAEKNDHASADGGAWPLQSGEEASYAAPPVYRVVRVDGHDEVLLRAANLHIGRAAYETARHLFPKDNIQYRNGAQIIARSDQGDAKR